MSADNTIVIIETKRTALENPKGVWTNRVPNTVFRVAHVQAFDNFDYYKKEQPYNLGAYLYVTFCKSPVFTKVSDALEYAQQLEKEIGYVEYGIQNFDLTEYVFWDDL